MDKKQGGCNICINRTEPMEKVRANKFIIREYKFVKVLEYENIFHMGVAYTSRVPRLRQGLTANKKEEWNDRNELTFPV